MAAPTTLAVQYKGSAVKVFRLVGGTTLTQIGSDVIAAVESPSTQDHYQNRAIQFGNDLYVWQADDIYRFNPITDAWDAEGLALSIQSGDRYHSGLYRMHVNGSPVIAGLFNTAASQMRSITLSSPGGTWSESGNLGSGANGFGQGKAIVYRNQLVSWRNSNVAQGHIIYDPATVSLIFTQGGADVTQNQVGSPVVFDGRLLSTGFTSTSATANWILLEFTGGTWITVQTLGASRANALERGLSTVYPSPCLFTNGTDLFWICSVEEDVTADRGDVFLRLVKNGSSFTETDLTETVIPAALRLSADPGDIDIRWTSQVDNDTAGTETDPAYHLHRRGSALADTYDHYQFIDISTEMITDGGGISSDVALAHFPNGGGGYIWTQGEVTSEIIGATAKIGAQQFSYKVYGDAVTVRHFTVTAGPFQVAETLTGGTSGATGTVTFVDATNLHVRVGATSPTLRFAGGELITGGTSNATADVNDILYHGSVTSGPFQVAEVVTGGSSTAFGTVAEIENLVWVSLHSVTGVFIAGEIITGMTSNAEAPLLTNLLHGDVTGGPFQIGETLTGAPSTATGVVKIRGSLFTLVDTVTGTFLSADVVTGVTSLATATLAAGPAGEVGTTGGGADKELRIYFDANEEPCAGAATLKASTASGGFTNNTTVLVKEVVADDGATTYTVQRNTTADSLTTGDKEQLVPHIATAS